MPKLRPLGPGSWFIPGQNTLHEAHALYTAHQPFALYLDGIVVQAAPNSPTVNKNGYPPVDTSHFRHWQ